MKDPLIIRGSPHGKTLIPENAKIKKYSYQQFFPFASLSPITKLFFSWALKTINLANIIKLTPTHLGNLSPKQTSSSFLEKIYHVYDTLNYKSLPKHSVLKTILKSNLSNIIIIVILSILSATLNIVSINLFRHYIIQFKQTDNAINEYLIIGGALLLVQLINIFLNKQLNHFQNFLGDKAGIEVNCLIFEKILRRSNSSTNQQSYSDTAQIINFIQLDSQKLTVVISLFSTAISLPIIILSYSFMLFLFLGWCFIFGFIVLLLFLAFNFCLQNKLKNNQKNKQQCSDKRMKVTSETLFNLKGLKLYGWESYFSSKINQTRENELSALKNIFSVTNLIRSLLWFSPVGTGIITIGAYFYYNTLVRIEDLFTCLGILSSIQDPIRGLTNIYTNLIEVFVSMKRIETFLKEDDINKQNIITNDESTSAKNIVIQIENGSYTWGTRKSNSIKAKIDIKTVESNNIKAVVNNINLTVNKGELVCIIGDVGCGKSSLFQAILNNLTPISPKQNDTRLIVNGTIAYLSQVPWIQSASLKNNILFYKEMLKEKYDEILHRTDLVKDIDIFIKGDETEIGERGINLSGGQKLRIALARAMYSDKDIYLLDDPLSSLDANVGTKIMKECICDYLKGKTRILITNSLQYLSLVDRIIYMKNGKIEWNGNNANFNLLKQGFFQTIQKQSSNHIKTQLDIQLNNHLEKNRLTNNKGKAIEPNSRMIPNQNNDNAKPLHVSMSIYIKYITFLGGTPLMIILVIITILWQSMRGGADLWLAYWSKQNSNFNYHFAIYSCLGIGASLFLFIRLVIISRGSINSSRMLHNIMSNKIIKAPINLYYDTIQKGQIINKLSKDLSIIDFFSSVMFGNILSFGATVFSAIVICSFHQPYCLLFVPFLFSCGLYLMRFYLVCSRELTRIEAMTRTPMINIINEVNEGTDTIRAFQSEATFKKQFKLKADDNLKVKLFISGTSQWFNLMLDLLTFTLRWVIILFTIYYRNYFSPQIIGIILTYLIQIEDNLTRFILCFSTFENTMVAFDRCLSIDSIPQEKASKTDTDKAMPSDWPINGSVTFDNVSVKYRSNTEIVLNKLSFNIKAGEKIGIAGRTGSGKSTIALCFFRILELMEGVIKIDNVDISTIGLDKLRSSITIIPQDPFLIEGTLRDNIDPLHLYSDNLIEETMREIGFDYILNNNPMGLRQNVNENGSNYSSGEKQLICITRAILRKSKVVIMDEATSSIDYNTEESIQKAFKSILKDSTIITIAHRIKTILGMDRIIVIDEGKLVEFDSPSILMENGKGLFTQLYRKSLTI